MPPFGRMRHSNPCPRGWLALPHLYPSLALLAQYDMPMRLFLSNQKIQSGKAFLHSKGVLAVVNDWADDGMKNQWANIRS